MFLRATCRAFVRAFLITSRDRQLSYHNLVNVFVCACVCVQRAFYIQFRYMCCIVAVSDLFPIISNNSFKNQYLLLCLWGKGRRRQCVIRDLFYHSRELIRKMKINRAKKKIFVNLLPSWRISIYYIDRKRLFIFFYSNKY